ncbi:sigma-70 family RNA polymerase sigma factor [Streptomyces sp. NPDC002054]|uniref:sigma-70 family RNA polymerase sigma factor n=1 Tax=Streptomyces sp. NPDC002054 TaxID=3154663 RepID=UPI00331B4A84
METPTTTEAGDPAPRTMGQEALAEIYRRHGPYLLRALIPLTNGDHGRAEDILQETLLRAWQNPDALRRGPEHARPWLFTVARRIAIDHLRVRAARVHEVTDEALSDGALTHGPYDPYDPYAAVLEAQDVAHALDQLEPHHREVLVELHLNDRSVADTAAKLRTPAGTVKSRNHYAIRAIRRVLERRGDTGRPAAAGPVRPAGSSSPRKPRRTAAPTGHAPGTPSTAAAQAQVQVQVQSQAGVLAPPTAARGTVDINRTGAARSPRRRSPRPWGSPDRPRRSGRRRPAPAAVLRDGGSLLVLPGRS